MALSKDWREFLELLNSRGVDYVIVGAHSLALHGRPRYTGDLDVLVRSTPENARLLVDILNAFGFAESGFQELDLRFTKRFDAAFVNSVFLWAWFRRLKNSPP